MSSTNSSFPDSGDKNCYQFLFKLLGKHFPNYGTTWHNTYDKLKKESSESGKNTNIHWKQIFNRLVKEALRKGVEEVEWKTLTALLEMVSRIENYLTLNGKELIKWRDKEKEKAKKGKQAFINKCKQIRPTILNLLKVGIDKNSSQFPKQDFYNYLEENVVGLGIGMMDYTNNSHNLFLETIDNANTHYENSGEDYLFHQNPSKRMRTEDFTYYPMYSSQLEENFLGNNILSTNFNSVRINEEEEEEKTNAFDFSNLMPECQNSFPQKDNKFIENSRSEKQIMEENIILKAENQDLRKKNKELVEELEKMRKKNEELERTLNSSNFESGLEKNMDNLNFYS